MSDSHPSLKTLFRGSRAAGDISGSAGWWGSQMSVCHGPHLPPESTSNALATANRLPVDLLPRPCPICASPADHSVMKGRLYFGKEILCFSAICSAIAFGKISK
jgi:hypothetical protein